MAVSPSPKFPKQQGRPPVLQSISPDDLLVDDTYQRAANNEQGNALIRRIAHSWDWSLCQPLVVSRRANDELYVIDGQHRLAAAKMRGDIGFLPCVIINYPDPAAEAAGFVALNQQRRPLTRIELFRAAVVAGDPVCCEIVEAMDAIGLSLAPHATATAWKPGQIGQIGGIETVWRLRGRDVGKWSLKVIADAFSGEVLSRVGTIFPGIAVVVADELKNSTAPFTRFIELVGSLRQEDWARLVGIEQAENNSNRETAGAAVFRAAWRSKITPKLETPDDPPANRLPPVKVAPPISFPKPQVTVTPHPLPKASHAPERRWCEQCERNQSLMAAATCTSRFCKLRPALTTAGK